MEKFMSNVVAVLMNKNWGILFPPACKSLSGCAVPERYVVKTFCMRRIESEINGVVVF